jgi:DNA-binding HxlR family transcriptional regulator
MKGGCPVELTASVIGGVWKPMILYHLLVSRKMRFMELSRAVPGATQRMLTLQLRELEADGIVIRTVYPEVPPRVEYELTPIGRQLGSVMRCMSEWGLGYRDERQRVAASAMPDVAVCNGAAAAPA